MKGCLQTAVAAFGLIWALAAAETKAAVIDVVMALPSSTLTFATAFIAEDAGIYQKHGLHVTTRYLVGLASTAAVADGQADFLIGTGATFLNAAARGQRLLAIAKMSDRPLIEMVVRKDVAARAGITETTPFAERIRGLKGSTIAVQGTGTIAHSIERLVARKAGLDPDTDMKVAAMEPQAMLPAMLAKRIDGYAASPPFTTEAVVNGDAILLASGPRGDLADYLPFDYTVLQTRAEVCHKEPEKCLRMVAAYKEATEFIRTRPNEALDLVRKRFTQIGPAILEAAWPVVAEAHAKDIRVTREGLNNAQRWSLDAGLLDLKGVITDFSGLYTADYVK
jgi:NitT/TauT family transport system substrate-binding protein